VSTPIPVAPPAPDLSGLLLGGRYELQAVIGEGTFGHVYRGVDRRLDRTVAVKLIKPWWASDPSWVHAFEREARLLARVSDPGIVQIFDVAKAGEGLYYVAEYVDGESLAARLRRAAMDPWDACEVAEQLCRALGRAHAAGIVHRDIKPANVLLSSGGQVKLADFGIARLAEEGTDASFSAMIAGTPKYMAPEHARGLRTSSASDTYSVGVVLYEMLAGVPPFSGTAAVDVALSHLQDEPPPLPSTTPRELAGVVTRALAKQPADRYQDGHAMAAALAQARKSAEAERRAAPTAGYRAPAAHNGRHPAETAAGPDATRRAPRRTPRRDFNPAGRRRTIAIIGVALAVLAAMALGAVLLASPSRVRVPQLHGLSRAAIVAQARRAGLRPVFTSRHDSASTGTAIAQAPSVGRRVDSGSTVRVVLSSGPPPVELPQLVGQGSGSATSILSSLGLHATVTAVPAPGVRPGTVTAQSPAAGQYVPARHGIALSVAETPSWRPVTSFSGTDAGQSVVFRIRGTQFRLVYGMGYVGTCTFIFFCEGPSAQVTGVGNSSTQGSFGLNSGQDQTHVVKAGAGLYEVRVKAGMDTARWSIEVEDYY
jgi:serine/threonine-protein kinase